MELEEILERIVTIIPKIDKEIEVPRTKNGNQYIPCVGTANETTFVRTLMQRWKSDFPSELSQVVVENRSKECPEGSLEIHYDLEKFSGPSADVGFSTSSSSIENDIEWLIEFKKIEFVGDIGGKSRHQEVAIAKLFSPFLSHTKGVLHDIHRIISHPLGRRRAVIIYACSLDESLIEHSKNHPRRKEQIHPDKTIDRGEQFRKLMKSANNQPFSLLPMLTPFEVMCKDLNFKLGKRVHRQFSNLENHPIYVQGDIVAWEVLGDSSA